MFFSSRKNSGNAAPDAEFKSGLRYFKGEGIEKDEQKARACFRNAAEKGHAGAQYYYGLMFAGEDDSEAAKWYEKSALQGHPKAQCALANLYRWGFGIPIDYSKAFEWYAAAANQGSEHGQYGLAELFEHGIGTRVNLTEAVRWTRKAAEQGFAKAQYDLGVFYFKGEGLPMDWNEARRWILLAMQQGCGGSHVNFEFNLEMLEALDLRFV